MKKIKALDVYEIEIKIGDKVWELINGEVAEVIEIINENKIKLLYVGEENFLKGEVAEVNSKETEIIGKKMQEGYYEKSIMS